MQAEKQGVKEPSALQEWGWNRSKEPCKETGDRTDGVGEVDFVALSVFFTWGSRVSAWVSS